MRKWLFTGAAIAAAGWAVWENSALQTTQLTVYAKRLPKVFDGFCVVHISDLHNTVFGKHNQKLLSYMQKAQPDIIVITGDLLNSYHTDMAAALEFAAQAARIAPCYYVSGNHESRISAYPWFRNQLTEKGIVVLENRALKIAYQGQAIRLIGLVDSSFSPEYPAVCAREIASRALAPFTKDDIYTILLSHRPELFDTYAESQADLVFSGHAHGGQIRLPLIGAVFAPNQGFFPKYNAGIYRKGRTQMIVSRGLGNSSFPIRLHNRPEIIAATLYAQ
ncbi:MAG: metallophosphoesterase [Butyricicoccus pullicaecorum]|nr:metallophosphoesterase [Butyricicoccus pullicaecorum]MDO4669000.1 metallophosphoesterase [Butyricicoccus pullicaecorum]